MINRSFTMKSLIRLIVISFFIIADVMAAVMAESPTVSPEIKDPSAKLDDIKKSSKLMKIRKIKKYSKHECTKEMKKHIKGITLLWLETDEAMEKKEDKKCENHGGLEIEGVDFGLTLFFRALV